MYNVPRGWGGISRNELPHNTKFHVVNIQWDREEEYKAKCIRGCVLVAVTWNV